MTEPKKNPNPFVEMAKQTKKNNPVAPGNRVKVPKPNRGVNTPTMVRRSGRGG